MVEEAAEHAAASEPLAGLRGGYATRISGRPLRPWWQRETGRKSTPKDARMARPDILILIPARMAATRLPGKPLADIAGKPMIEHVVRRAEAADSAR